MRRNWQTRNGSRFSRSRGTPSGRPRSVRGDCSSRRRLWSPRCRCVSMWLAISSCRNHQAMCAPSGSRFPLRMDGYGVCPCTLRLSWLGTSSTGRRTSMTACSKGASATPPATSSSRVVRRLMVTSPSRVMCGACPSWIRRQRSVWRRSSWPMDLSARRHRNPRAPAEPQESPETSCRNHQRNSDRPEQRVASVQQGYWHWWQRCARRR
jgi:hypothetical protein